MRLSAIVAMASNGIIGSGNGMPWQLPADLARFRRITMGHTLIMGRKTYESIGRPLPGRTTIVLTHRPNYAPPGVKVAHSVREALDIARNDSEVFIAGGAEIYAQTITRWERLYLTLVERDFVGDTQFPNVDFRSWRLSNEEKHRDAPLPFTFRTYDRAAHP